MFFDRSSFFFKRNSVNSLISICISNLKDKKLLVSAIKTPELTITDRKFHLPGGLTNGEGSLAVAIMARILQLGRPLMSNPDSCEIISKSDQRFLRRRFFKNFFMSVTIVQKVPIQQSHVYRQIKISQTIFEKGHPRNIPVKLFQNLTIGFREDFLRIFSCPYSARSLHSPEPC